VNESLWAVDVGNTRIKAGRFDGDGRLVEVIAADPAAPDLPLTGTVAVLSVSAPNEAALLEVAARRPGVAVRVLGRDVPLSIENRTRRPEEVGLDRLANAAAAHVRSGGAAVVGDVGTAITVDAVDVTGAFAGGTIAPGPLAALEGLRARAPHLPDPGDAPSAGALGGTTSEAMAGALEIGFAGLLDRLLGEAAAALGGEPEVFLTGGGAERIGGALRTPVTHVPHLTLEGIHLLARRAGLRAG
jgi:type III pantothenate kinase